MLGIIFWTKVFLGSYRDSKVTSLTCNHFRYAFLERDVKFFKVTVTLNDGLVQDRTVFSSKRWKYWIIVNKCTVCGWNLNGSFFPTSTVCNQSNANTKVKQCQLSWNLILRMFSHLLLYVGIVWDAKHKKHMLTISHYVKYHQD